MFYLFKEDCIALFCIFVRQIQYSIHENIQNIEYLYQYWPAPPTIHRGLEWPQFLNSPIVLCLFVLCLLVCLWANFLIYYSTVQYTIVQYSTVQYSAAVMRSLGHK